LWGGTFHSVGARLLRRHAGIFGHTDNFSILDESDQRDLMRLCVTDVGVEVERRRFPSPRVLTSLVSLQANTQTPLQELLMQRYPRFLDWSDEIAAVCDRYAERKRAANAMDYDDLLVLWLRALEEVPELRRRYGRQFRYVLVDEYQDTNLVQGRIVEAIAAENGGNLMVVGDDCQSIYAFRGAHYDNILEFPERNPDTEVFKLEINYRSTPEILELTNASIRCNRDQYQKRLSARRGHGMTPALVPCNYPEQEAAFVAERILQLRDEGVALRDIAVLYRAHSHRLSVETTLLRYDIPYEVRGGLRFFEQAHIKDVTAFLRLLHNPQDEVALRRVLLMQPGIGNVTARRIREALGEPEDAGRLLGRLGDDEVVRHLRRGSHAAWEGLTELLGHLIDSLDDPEGAIRMILEGGYDEYAAGEFTNYESRIEDLEQLALFAGQYDGVGALLEELILLGEMYGQDVRAGGEEDEEGGVVLSTVHQAKGLEWEAVFLIHLLEGALPSPRAVDEPGGEQEERRVFYVAMTRARSELYLCYPIVRPGGGRGGAVVQQPSRFVQELPADLTEVWEIAESRVDEAVDEGADDDPWADDPNVDPIWDD
ncbi:MAG: ATP-dependent helicase, partial [Acidobacteriota bacterium]